MRKRNLLLQFFFLLLSAAVIVRLFTLQVLSYDFYKNLAENQHQLYQTLIPQRGEVFVREKDGKLIPVITNIEKDLVFAVPPEIVDKEAVARALSPVLEMSSAEILDKISDDDRKWIMIKKELLEPTSLAVEELNLPGIYLQPETLRLYPEHDFASQVLGFVAFEDDKKVGQYGVEEYYEEFLAGISG